MTNFSIATNEYRAGEERTEFHSIVAWDRLAEICGQYLEKGQLVALEGRLQTRSWDDEDGRKVLAFNDVLRTATRYNTNMRIAAFILAILRVVEVVQLRGIYA